MKTLETVLLPDTKQILRFSDQLSVLLTAFMSWETNSILQTRDPGLYRQSSSQQTSKPPKRFIWWWYIWDRPTYISKTAPNLVLLSTTHTNHAFPSDLIIRLIFLNADCIMRQCGCYLEVDRYLHMKAVTYWFWLWCSAHWKGKQDQEISMFIFKDCNWILILR